MKKTSGRPVEEASRNFHYRIKESDFQMLKELGDGVVVNGLKAILNASRTSVQKILEKKRLIRAENVAATKEVRKQIAKVVKQGKKNVRRSKVTRATAQV